jgi:hypothetical protein
VPIAIVCPACGVVGTFHRAPVATCANCQAALPPELRSSAEATLVRQRVGRPLLLTLGLYGAPGFGALALLGVACAGLGIGSYSINGQSVSGSEFLAQAGPYLGAVGLLSLLIGFGIWRERPWTRWVIVAFWAVSLAGGAGLGWSRSGLGGAAGGLAQSLLPAILATWYCFGKDNVVAYYRALEVLDGRQVLGGEGGGA